MKSNLFQFCGGYQSAAELLTKADFVLCYLCRSISYPKKQTQKYIFNFKP